MSLQTWNETLVSAVAAGTNFTTFTTAKSVTPAGCTVTFPPNYFYVGRSLRINVLAGISNIITTPGTITFQMQLGPTSNIAAFTSGAIQLNAIAHTTLPAWLEILLTCRAVGSGTSANLIGMCHARGVMFTRTAAQVDQLNIGDSLIGPATAPAVGTGFDSTVANILDFFTAFSISNAGNGIQVQQYTVESMN